MARICTIYLQKHYNTEMQGVNLVMHKITGSYFLKAIKISE